MHKLASLQVPCPTLHHQPSLTVFNMMQLQQFPLQAGKVNDLENNLRTEVKPCEVKWSELYLISRSNYNWQLKADVYLQYITINYNL